MTKKSRFDDMLTALRRVSGAASDLGAAGRAGRTALGLPPAATLAEPKFCDGCRKPECDYGCVYAPKRKEEPVTRIVERMPASIHDPVVPFGAPVPKPTIADAYRAAGQEIVAAIDNMLRTCEEARVEGLKLVDALYEHGDWHDEFLASYVTVQTEAAGVMRDAWKRQIEELRDRKLLTMKTTGTEPATTEGGTS